MSPLIDMSMRDMIMISKLAGEEGRAKDDGRRNVPKSSSTFALKPCNFLRSIANNTGNSALGSILSTFNLKDKDVAHKEFVKAPLLVL